MKEFWSSRIRGLTPYTPGEQPRERKFIKLNTNENPYPPSPMALSAIRAAADNLYIATVNSCYGVNPCSASSGIVSPRGEYLVKAPGVGEQFFCADLPL